MYYGHGTDNPFDEAVYLVLRALALPFDVDDAVLDAPITGEERRRVMVLVERRIQLRLPVAYLINEAWFSGLPFYVDERVLVPRSPIAELIEERFSPWLQESAITRILDIGTGSGCIAVACALAFPHARVDAVDSSSAALAVADRNIVHYQLSDRVRLLQSDLYAALGAQRYDVIVANPPYVSANELSHLPPEYRHEPLPALHAGEGGLAVVRRLLTHTRPHLEGHGVLIVEVGNRQDAVSQAFPDLPFIWLEFERGGEGVFLLRATDLAHSSAFAD